MGTKTDGALGHNNLEAHSHWPGMSTMSVLHFNYVSFVNHGHY